MRCACQAPLITLSHHFIVQHLVRCQRVDALYRHTAAMPAGMPDDAARPAPSFTDGGEHPFFSGRLRPIEWRVGDTPLSHDTRPHPPPPPHPPPRPPRPSISATDPQTGCRVLMQMSGCGASEARFCARRGPAIAGTPGGLVTAANKVRAPPEDKRSCAADDATS